MTYTLSMRTPTGSYALLMESEDLAEIEFLKQAEEADPENAGIVFSVEGRRDSL